MGELLTSVEPRYRIRAVAAMVGLSEDLIRAWERRYEIVVPSRSDSGYRTYGRHDVQLLQRVKALVDGGMSIGDVAPMLPGLRRELEAAPAAARPEALQLAAWQRRAIDAAEQLDQPRVEQVLNEVFAAFAPSTVMDAFVTPLQREVGERWHANKLHVAHEHLISDVIRRRLIGLVQATPSLGPGHAVCACFPDEQHELGLLGVALRFQGAGLRVTYLGPRTPVDAVGELAKKLKPDVVALSVSISLSATQIRTDLTRLMAWVPKRVRVIVGGTAVERDSSLFTSAGATLITPEEWNQPARLRRGRP